MSPAARRAAVFLGFLALAGLAVVAWARCLDASTLPEVTRYRDDAYYYFDFVRALARGEGPCVTPGQPTNGIHAIWAAMLWPLYALFGDRGFVVGAAHLGLGLHALTALWLFALLGRSARAGAVALLYLGCPLLVTEAQNGQETALACFAAVACCQAFARGFAPACVAAAFALLSRSDLICLVVPLGLAHFGWRRGLAPAAIGFAALTAVNFALAGRLVQDSALPIPWLFAQHFERTGPDLAARAARLWWFLRPCLLGGPWAVASWAFGAALVAAAATRVLPRAWRLVPLPLTLLAGWLGAHDLEVPLAAAVLLALSAWPRVPEVARADASRLVWVALGFFVLAGLHLVLRTYPRDYYFAPLGVLGALALAAWPGRVGLAALAMTAAAHALALRGPRVEQLWQEQMAMAGRFLREVVPAGEPVGCFNSGILAFHDAGPVLNLDGVVNHAAFAALRAGQLDAWLDGARVRFLVDSAIQFRRDDPWPHCSGAHFGPDFDPDRDLLELARCVAPGVREPFIVYWRRGRGASPALPSAPRDLGPAPAFRQRPTGRYVLCPCPAGELWLRRVDGTGAAVLVTVAERPTCALLRLDAAAPGRYGLYAGAGLAPLFAVDL